MLVREIMTSQVDVINPGTTIRDAARRMRDENVGALPVGENDRLVGMVSDRDIVMRGVAEDGSPSGTTVRDVMSNHVYCCFEDDDIDAAAQAMAEHQVRRLPVLNQEKRLVGVVALADMARTGSAAAAEALQGVSEASGQPRRS